MNRRKGYRAIAVAGAACAALTLPATTAASAKTAPTPAAHGTGALTPTNRVAAPAVSPGISTPASADLTPYTVPVGDQGQVGSCVAWAIDYSMMGVYAREQGRSDTQYAPMYVYSQTQYNAGRDGNEGSYPYEAYDITQAQGVDTKAHYTQGSFDWWTLPTASERANAAQARSGGFTDLYASSPYYGGPVFGANERAAIQNAVSQGRPVALSLEVYPSFDYLSPQQPWILANSDAGATLDDSRGGHEVLIVGYDSRGVKIQNSWGTGWGQGGFGHIEWGYLARTWSSPWQSNAPLVAFELSVLNPFTFPPQHGLAVYRPSNGTWYVRGVAITQYGAAGDIPVPADYNGDGKIDLAVYRPSNGTWYVRGISTTQWGQRGDVPVVADFNGDGKTDLAVWRPSNGTWYVRGILTTRYGASGDIPVPADYNGDRKADLAVWRPSNGTWYVRGGATTRYGASGDVPVIADYNGDGKADLAVWRPSNGTWYVRGISTTQYGMRGDVPVVADYTGDHRADLVVWRPSNGTWNQRGGVAVQWGLRGDIPVRPV